jgi:hypothetical protein
MPLTSAAGIFRRRFFVGGCGKAKRAGSAEREKQRDEWNGGTRETEMKGRKRGTAFYSEAIVPPFQGFGSLGDISLGVAQGFRIFAPSGLPGLGGGRLQTARKRNSCVGEFRRRRCGGLTLAATGSGVARGVSRGVWVGAGHSLTLAATGWRGISRGVRFGRGGCGGGGTGPSPGGRRCR